MSVRGVILIVSFLVALVANFVSIMLIGLMTDAVNKGRQPAGIIWPDGGRFGPFVAAEIARQYRARYPDGKLHRRLRVAYIVTCVSFGITAVTLLGFGVSR